MEKELKNKQIEIDNLKWITWSSIILVALISAKTAQNIFYHHIEWTGVIISLAVYLYIAFTIGQHKKYNEDIIITLFLSSLLILILIGQFINVYLYLLNLGVLVIGYYVGTCYQKDTDEDNGKTL